MTERDNPLWALPDPFTFDSVQAADVVDAAERLITEATAKVAAITAPGAPRTYAGTFGAHEEATSRLERCTLLCEHIENASSSDAFRAAWGVAQPKITAFWSELPLTPGLYEAMQSAFATEQATLPPLARRHAEKTLADFARRGARLDDVDKKKLVEIDVALSAATTKFMQNALDATNAYELYVEDEGRLAGLPPHAVEGARRAASDRKRDGWRFSLQAPSFLPVITYADDAALRKELFLAYNARAAATPFDNVPVIREVLSLRQRKAKLLGFADIADYVLEDRMAKSGERARAFVRDLAARTRPFFEKERAELAAFAAKPLEAWDTAYFANKLREARHAFDDEALRPYLPMEAVLAGAFQVMQRLYGVRFVPTQAAVWHETVRPFALESESGTLLATVYLDLFPRESKVQGAWMAPLRVGGPGAASSADVAHQAVVCCNFTPPTGDAPALLNHREVETLFHELGHLMHQCLSRVPIRSLAGTNVAWDFVELPSQIMENWTWEPETLRMFAKHHQTGADLPRDLFDRLLATRTFRAASAQMQQLGYAELDFALHCDHTAAILDPSSPLDVLGIGREVMQRHVSAPLPDGYAMITSFGHLFGNPVGYAAGYYSYKWAEVLDADAFGRFREEGVLARAVGERFRSKVLERGAAAEPEDLFRDFMGRDPRPDALLERQGLHA